MLVSALISHLLIYLGVLENSYIYFFFFLSFSKSHRQGSEEGSNLLMIHKNFTNNFGIFISFFLIHSRVCGNSYPFNPFDREVQEDQIKFPHFWLKKIAIGSNTSCLWYIKWVSRENFSIFIPPALLHFYALASMGKFLHFLPFWQGSAGGSN